MSPAPASKPIGLNVAAAAPVKPLTVLLGLEGVFVALPPLPLPVVVGSVPLFGGGGEEPVPVAEGEEEGQ
jgi:hypothetical protein